MNEVEGMKHNRIVRAFELPIQAIEPKEGWALLRRCFNRKRPWS